MATYLLDKNKKTIVFFLNKISNDKCLLMVESNLNKFEREKVLLVLKKQGFLVDDKISQKKTCEEKS